MLKAMEHKDIVQHQSIYYTSEAVALTFTSMSNFKTEATRKCCTAPADNFPFCYHHQIEKVEAYFEKNLNSHIQLAHLN